MQAHSCRPVRTFTIGSFDADCDEASPARAVARHLGTDHTELYVVPDDAVDVIPQMPSVYDEPFADPSQIPTYLLSRLTRQHVTVALSGDGGDELFAGIQPARLGSAHLEGAAADTGRRPPERRTGPHRAVATGVDERVPERRTHAAGPLASACTGRQAS